MAEITLRVLDGADRGKTFDQLRPPITIGREEGNTVQLNDDRVSRFHVKIQEDHQRLVLTDLESTNGTKVNGEDIQLRILRYGDMIAVGRSVLLFGSRSQIAHRLQSLREREVGQTANPDDAANSGRSSLDFDVNWPHDSLQATLHNLQPPELPDRLGPGQAAQLAELLEYFHIRLRNLLHSAQSNGEGERMQVDLRQWQNLLDLQSRISEYLRTIGDPDPPDDA